MIVEHAQCMFHSSMATGSPGDLRVPCLFMHYEYGLGGVGNSLENYLTWNSKQTNIILITDQN